MPSRTAASTRLRTAVSAPIDDERRRPDSADPALDEALERISDLAARLWAVRSAHRPVAVGWLRAQTRCAGCGQPVPCATLLAAG